MLLPLPVTTHSMLEELDRRREPLLEYQIADQLSAFHRADGLSDVERNGAWAEAAAFHFMPIKGGPWGTYYGPFASATAADGKPWYAPDIAQIDNEIIFHWESRFDVAQHPVLRARYADLVWDLNKRVTGTPPQIKYANGAIDAYLDAVESGLYKEPPIHVVEASRRALQLALSIGDTDRIGRTKQAMTKLFNQGQPGEVGVWGTAYDTLLESKKIGITSEERQHLVDGLEQILEACTNQDGKNNFDPWSGQAAAHRLASHYEREGRQDDVQRVIRTYGKAFEYLASQAGPMFAMSWLQPVHDEYKNRGMHEDALRVSTASAEKGKDVAQDLKPLKASFAVTDDRFSQFIETMTEGSVPEALLRVTAQFIPKSGNIKAMLQETLTSAPLMARIGITKIVGDHFAAEAGSIENDPEGRLIMGIADHLQLQNGFLQASLTRLREKVDLTPESILEVLDLSPVFDQERRAFLEEGIKAYVAGDHIKAIHVLIPQIEQALRQTLLFCGGSALKGGRNGVMQQKNLNDILREPALAKALGEDIRLYLLTLLADERGVNIRNTVCHGLAGFNELNPGLSAQILHALLTVSLVRKKQSQSN